jgi:hypothetical protein
MTRNTLNAICLSGIALAVRPSAAGGRHFTKPQDNLSTAAAFGSTWVGSPGSPGWLSLSIWYKPDASKSCLHARPNPG